MTDTVSEDPVRKRRRVRMPSLIPYALMTLVVLMGAFNLLGRLALAGAEGYREALAQRLGAAVGAEVSLTSLRGRWIGWDPVLDVGGFSLSPPGASPAIEVDRVHIELDVLESLLRRRPVASALVLTGTRVELERRADGSIGLRGGREGAEPPIRRGLEFLYDSDYVQIDQADIRVHGADDRVDHLDVRGLLDNSGLLHRGDLALALVAAGEPPGTPARLALTYALRGNLFDGRTLRGDVLLDMQALPLASLADGSGGRALSGTIERMRIRAELEALGIRLRSTLTAPQLRLSGEQDVTLSGLRLTMEGWAINESGGDLLLTEGRGILGRNGIVLDGLHLSWRNTGSVMQWFLQLPTLEADRLLDVVQDLDLGDDRLQQWLRNLDPRGTLSSTRLWVDPSRGLFALAADLRGAGVDPYRGVPDIRGVDGVAVLFERGGWVDIDTGPFFLGFPGLFERGRRYDGASGRLAFAWADGIARLRSDVIELRTALGRIGGAFSLYIPREREDRRLHLLLGVREGDASRIDEFLPVRLDPTLREWLQRAVVGGRVLEGGLLISGPMFPTPEHRRSVSIWADVEGATLAYDRNWPAAVDTAGRLLMEAGAIDASIDRARLAGLEIGTTAVNVGGDASGRWVALEGRGHGDAQTVIDFLRGAPLGERLDFLDAGWRGDGSTDFEFDLLVPLGAEVPLRSRIAAEASLSRLDIPQGRLRLENVRGRIAYAEPGLIESSGLEMDTLGGPALVDLNGDFSPDGHGLLLRVRGRAEGGPLGEWLQNAVTSGMDGPLPYAGRIALSPDGSRTDISLLLEPEEFGSGLPAPLDFSAVDDVRLTLTIPAEGPLPLELRWDGGLGHLRLGPDGGLQRGLIALGPASAEPFSPLRLPDAGLRIRGQTLRLEIGDWLATVARFSEASRSDPGTGSSMLVDAALQVERLNWDDLALGDSWITLASTLDEADIGVRSPVVEGNVRVFDDDRPIQVALSRITLSEPDDEIVSSAVPELTASLMPLAIEPGDIPEFVFRSDSVRLGDEELGTASFHVRPKPGGLYLTDIEANIRGLRVEGGDARLDWNMQPLHSTRFRGRITGDDLTDVLPRWGFAPSVESDEFRIDADVTWPGPPDLFALAALDGEVNAQIDDGTFVQVEAVGAMRVMGLLNLAALARRMRLDFSDIYERGIAFDEAQGRLRFAAGNISTAESLSIVGPGSRFEATGTIDLIGSTLDANMVVTLPLSNNLPWLAASAAVLNPLAGAGVLVAQQVFRDQIDRYSSAAYRISGPLAEPEVRLLAVVDENGEPTETDPADVPRLEDGSGSAQEEGSR